MNKYTTEDCKITIEKEQVPVDYRCERYNVKVTIPHLRAMIMNASFTTENLLNGHAGNDLKEVLDKFNKERNAEVEKIEFGDAELTVTDANGFMSVYKKVM